MVPTYRRKDLFNICFESYRAQTYPNFTIRIGDNSLADGYNEIERIVREADDPRVIYQPNSTNLGAVANYNRLLNSTEGDYFLITSSDIALEPECLQELYNLVTAESCPVSFAQARAVFFDEDRPDELVPTPFPEKRAYSAQEFIYHYFSEIGVDRPFIGFAVFTSLINTHFFRANHLRLPEYCHHGIEDYAALNIAERAGRIAIHDLPLVRAYINNERYDDAARPENHYTRYEPIRAAADFLRDAEPRLLRNGYDLDRLWTGISWMCQDYFKRFRGFDTQIAHIYLSSLRRRKLDRWFGRLLRLFC